MSDALPATTGILTWFPTREVKIDTNTLVERKITTTTMLKHGKKCPGGPDRIPQLFVFNFFV